MYITVMKHDKYKDKLIVFFDELGYVVDEFEYIVNGDTYVATPNQDFKRIILDAEAVIFEDSRITVHI